MRRLNYIITLHATQGDYFFVPVIVFIKTTIKETSDRSNTPNAIINDIVSYVLIRSTSLLLQMEVATTPCFSDDPNTFYHYITFIVKLLNKSLTKKQIASNIHHISLALM
jgi:hypothetical protein